MQCTEQPEHFVLHNYVNIVYTRIVQGFLLMSMDDYILSSFGLCLRLKNTKRTPIQSNGKTMVQIN